MSSFVKIKKESIEIDGVRASIRNSRITSTGSDSLDFVIGGGIELSSLLLIGEDRYGRYSNILTKLFLADGFHHKHRIYFVNLDGDPRKLIKDIPPGSQQQKEKANGLDNDDLRIAFRYQDMPKIDSVQKSCTSGVSYDLSKKVEADQVEKYEKISFLSFLDFKSRQKNFETPFETILEDIRKLSSENKDNILRICINSLGSPLWFSETFTEDLLRFLVQLKSIVRYNENIVCFISMPFHLIKLIDDQLIFRIRKLVDVNINLESFDDVDKQTNAVFKQYHGLINVKKLQTITAHQSHKPESFDLAFKLKSHRFVIEKLHLPPELGDSDSSHSPAMSCSTSGGGNKALDF